MNIHRLYSVFFKYFRKRRMDYFQQIFNINEETEILDVGGTETNWKLLTVKPKITFVNLNGKGSNNWVIGDGRYLPFKDKSFDIVFSNSVIEHLYSSQNQTLFAQECRRVGKQYFVQTPNKRFFIEPHLITPFIHYLPKKLQYEMLRKYTIWGLLTKPDKAGCQKFLDEVLLLDQKDFSALFFDADIMTEKLLGMSKSLIAIKREI